MKLWRAVILLAASTAVACGGTGAPPMATPMSPTAATMTGAWQGTASDSTGSMMGAGLTSAMMETASWTITQTGNTFTGTMRFAGYMGPPMTISGTMNGHTGTFTMMAPPASMMMPGGCTASATGSFDMDDMMTQFHGSYSGMNSCSGAFGDGYMSMHR